MRVPRARCGSRAPARQSSDVYLVALFWYGHPMPEHTPALFERVPRGLFGPLGDLYAELYWELLAELYRHEFEGEPFVVVRPTALDTAEAVIRGSRLWSERRQDLEALASQDASPLL